MDYFPLFINLKNKPCLVVGAGEIAARKIELLAKAGADITVIAPEISPQVSQLKNTYDLNIIQRSFTADDIHRQRLIISATNQKILINSLPPQPKNTISLLMSSITLAYAALLSPLLLTAHLLLQLSLQEAHLLYSRVYYALK